MKNANCSSLAQSRPDFLLPFLNFGEKSRNYFTRNVPFSERSEYKIKLGIIIMLLLAPFFALAQEECPESTPPKFDSEHEPRTLCQKYSPPGKFPNRFGTPNSHYASQIIANLNNGNNVFTGDIDLVGDLIIDQDFTLLNCKVRISPNVKIRVEAEVTFTLDGSKLFCCQDMWQGIDLDYNSIVESRNITEIEDAMVAIESPCTATMSIQNTVFNRNTVGIRLGYSSASPVDPCPSFPIFTQFSGNTFQCNAPLNGTISGVSFVGIQVYKTNVSIGALTSIVNTFRNIEYGIRFETQWWGTSIVSRCSFEGVLIDGIFMASGNLRVERCNFLNNGYRGINVLQTRGLIVRNNTFNCNDDVGEQINGDNVYRHIKSAGFSISSTVEIKYNHFGGDFSNSEKIEYLYGVELIGNPMMGGGSMLSVSMNNFDFRMLHELPASKSSNCIFLTGEFPSSTSTFIELNNFFLKQPVGPSYSHYLYGVSLINGNKNEVQINSNKFRNDALEPLTLSPALNYGISLQGSMGFGNVVYNNEIIRNSNTGFPADFYIGVYSLEFANTVFCHNNLQEASFLMYFQGTNMGVQYFDNIHTGGANGIIIHDGFIGEQGEEGGEHNGNKWYDKWINIISTLQASCTNEQQAANSRFWVHTPQSERASPNGYIYFSEYHPADIEPDQMNEWFKPDPTGFPSAGDCGIINITTASETDRRISNETIDLTGLSTAQGWNTKRYLYAKLMQNPQLQDDFPEFISFLTNESNTPIGKLFVVEQKILEGLQMSSQFETQLNQIKSIEQSQVEAMLLADSVMNVSTNAQVLSTVRNNKKNALTELRIQDSLYNEINLSYQAATMLKLQEALSTNNTIVTNNGYEQNEKTVNDIAIRRILFQNGELTTTQTATLDSIATQCPKYGGHGVYRARGLLTNTGCNEETWNDEYSGCYPKVSSSTPKLLENTWTERTKDTQLTYRVIAYPNPASEGIYVRTISGVSGQVLLQDMTGKICLEVQFSPSDDSIYLGLESIPSGVYACTVKGDNGEYQVSKIFVLKP
ncbi:MAG: T9SS type A sorting domain-containing protein [Saprospiraceae bacterium]|nr:T9SS type A sorting domain-containing protein [Saprospiraceae bacterium]